MNLRQRLRRDTRGAHEALDAMVIGFDVATPMGLARFLVMHALALEALKTVVQPVCETPSIGDLACYARRDLACLGVAVPAGRLMQQGARDPLGVRYVILGSHLGARMLQRRWRRSQLARVQAAGTFLAASASSAGWAELCDELAARDAYGDACENVVKDAHGVFDLYLTCAEIAKDHVADAQDLRRHSA